MRKPIRIVPLHPGREAARAKAPAPKLTYRGGPLLAQVEVFTIFWGSFWQEASQTDLASKLNAFFDYILTSPYLDQLAEYSVADYPIAHGQRSGSVTWAAPAPGKTLSDSAIQTQLHNAIQAATLPAPAPNRLYFLYLPSGVTVEMDAERSCQAFCGYHNHIEGKTFYAVMPYPDCSSCQGGLDDLDALTSTSSHELAEAITDPVPGQGWYNDQEGEIGDICAWQTKAIGSYTVQKEWSNKASACV